MIDNYLITIKRLDDSDLTDRMVRVALALLCRVNDRGELHIPRAEACELCEVEDANTVAKYLARLASANVLDWKGGNGSFHIWFTAWSGAAETLPKPAKSQAPAAASALDARRTEQPPAAQKWTPWAPNRPPASV